MYKFCVYLLCACVNALTIRTYSLVWRNSKDKVVKSVTYKNEVFQPMFENELNSMNSLINGNYYAYVFKHKKKILCVCDTNTTVLLDCN